MKQVSTLRLPIDIRVVMALGITSCIVHFGLVALMILGVGHVSEDTESRVLFGTIVLSSELSYGINAFMSGLLSVVFVHGLFRRTRWAWWYALVFMLYGVGDSAFGLTSLPVVAATSMLLSAGTIVWLVCRRQLFWDDKWRPPFVPVPLFYKGGR